jgi:hypothetical protein
MADSFPGILTSHSILSRLAKPLQGDDGYIFSVNRHHTQRFNILSVVWSNRGRVDSFERRYRGIDADGHWPIKMSRHQTEQRISLKPSTKPARQIIDRYHTIIPLH